MVMKFFSLFFASLLFCGVLFFFSGCSPTISSDSLSNTVVVSPSSPVCSPVRIANAFDQSGSMGWTVTKRITTDELKPVLPLLLRCGGEFSMTFIRSESNRPMFRFSVTEPTVEPILTPRGEDEEPFKFADRKNKFEKDHPAWKNKKIERDKIYGQKFEEFLAEIEPVLNINPKGGTDLWGAVLRSKIALSDSPYVWNSEPHFYLTLVSDGIDSMGKPKVVLDKKIKVFWVDSKTEDSVLRVLNAERCESFSAALASIVAIEGGTEK